MREPALGLAFILVQTAPGPWAPFAHVMCLPTSSSCMQSITIKEMRALLVFPATLPFHFPVQDMPIQPRRLLSSDSIRGQNVSRGNDTSAQEMMQPVMRSVPPRQLMPASCPPGTHFQVFPDEWGSSPHNPEASAWTSTGKGRHHQALSLMPCSLTPY